MAFLFVSSYDRTHARQSSFGRLLLDSEKIYSNSFVAVHNEHPPSAPDAAVEPVCGDLGRRPDII